MHKPLDHLSIMRINGPKIRNNGTKLGKPTKDTAPYLFNSKGRCELKFKDLATDESLANNKPIFKNLQEIVEIINLGNSDMDNRLTYLKVWKIFKEGTDNLRTINMANKV